MVMVKGGSGQLVVHGGRWLMVVGSYWWKAVNGRRWLVGDRSGGYRSGPEGLSWRWKLRWF